jgi:preprotein translocase subunit YajC
LTNSFFQPSPAPGRDVPAPAPAQPAQQAPATGAPPADGGAPPPGGLFGGGSTLLLFLLPLLLIFLMTRSQNKKQQKLEASLKTGDRVVTNSGLIGKIVELGERTTKLEIAPGVHVQMVKSAIQGLDATDTKPAETKQESKAKEPVKDKPQEKKA